MVTKLQFDRERGALATECVIALGILAAVMLPLSFSFMQEAKVFRAYYNRAIAMEIVDGEMELLAAGEWRAFPTGRQAYAVHAASATNLPPGEFLLTLAAGSARLEWIPRGRRAGGTVVREVKLK
jgi:hypothetical protein